jgi:hypothetical protein
MPKVRFFGGPLNGQSMIVQNLVHARFVYEEDRDTTDAGVTIVAYTYLPVGEPIDGDLHFYIHQLHLSFFNSKWH